MSEDGIFLGHENTGQSATQHRMSADATPFDENTISDEERADLGEPTPQDKKPCPECGKNLTWLADGSRPRRHKCVDKPAATEQETATPNAAAQPAPGGITIDMVVGAYVKTRDELTELKKKYEGDAEKLKALQEKRENWLNGQLTALGVESMRTPHGTAFIDWKDSATVADGAVFLNWVHESWEERLNFLENRVSKAAVKQHLGDGNTAPPGVNYTKLKGIKVRRA